MHNLPLDKQQVILELSAFFIQKKKAKKTDKNNQTFAEFLTQFRQEIEAEQLDIDISVFTDSDYECYD